MLAQFKLIREYEFTERGDRIGWVEGIDGKNHLTLYIENGRILDYPNKPCAPVEIAKIHKGDFRMTPNQNPIIAGVAAEDMAAIEKIARDHGLIQDDTSAQRVASMACVSLPTCPLAMAEAERYLPDAVTRLEGVLAQHGSADEQIIFRIDVQMVVGVQCLPKLGW